MITTHNVEEGRLRNFLPGYYKHRCLVSVDATPQALDSWYEGGSIKRFELWGIHTGVQHPLGVRVTPPQFGGVPVTHIIQPRTVLVVTGKLGGNTRTAHLIVATEEDKNALIGKVPARV